MAGVHDWREVLTHIAVWIQTVHSEHHESDLWREVAKEKTISGAAKKDEYEKPFAATELKQLETALADIELYMTTTQPLDPDGKQQVRKRFAYLLDAAKKGARKIDWLNIFVSQMIALVTTGLLEPKFYGWLITHAATVMNAIFWFGLKLLH